MRTMTQIRETIAKKQTARLARELAKGNGRNAIVVREARTILANLAAGK